MTLNTLVFVGGLYHRSNSAEKEFVWVATAAAQERREMGETTDHCAATHGRHPAPAVAYRNNVSLCSRVMLALGGGGIYRNAEKSKFLSSRR
jgi:hypothetical protein